VRPGGFDEIFSCVTLRGHHSRMLSSGPVGGLQVRMDAATRFYNRDEKVYDPCVATVTTHRVLWSAENNNIRLCTSLSLISAIREKGGIFKTPKLQLELGGDERSYVTVGFPKGGKNEFHKALTTAIAGTTPPSRGANSTRDSRRTQRERTLQGVRSAARLPQGRRGSAPTSCRRSPPTGPRRPSRRAGRVWRR
jgi:hypothetical protein